LEGESKPQIRQALLTEFKVERIGWLILKNTKPYQDFAYAFGGILVKDCVYYHVLHLLLVKILLVRCQICPDTLSPRRLGIRRKKGGGSDPPP